MTKTKETLIGVFVNAETGETIERELTSDEASYLASIQEAEQALNAEAQAKAAARESALAKLADLGLTAEEIAAL
jgi:hypothetical protein